MERLRLPYGDFNRISSLQQKSRAMCDWTRRGGNAAETGRLLPASHHRWWNAALFIQLVNTCLLGFLPYA